MVEPVETLRRKHATDCPDRVVVVVADGADRGVDAALERGARLVQDTGAAGKVALIRRLGPPEAVSIEMHCHQPHVPECLETTAQPPGQAPLSWLIELLSEHCCGTLIAVDRAACLPRGLQWLVRLSGDYSAGLRKAVGDRSSTWRFESVTDE